MSKKKKKGKSSNRPLKLTSYIKQAARKLPVLECRVIPGWKESGIAHIMISRQKPNGEILIGHFMVDIFCLGLKDTTYYMVPDKYEYEDYLDMLNSQNDFDIINQSLAFNLIYGAIEYAEDLGFEPHKDFAITEYILVDVDDVEYIDIEFGKDGKPFYMSGPYDNVEKIINTLKKSVGDGNFEFVAHLNNEHDFKELDKELDDKLDTFFPEERINKKMNSLSDDDKSVFEIYLRASEVLLEMSEANIEILTEQLEDDDFFDEAFEELKRRIVDENIKKNKEEEKALNIFIERNMIFISEKLIEYGNIEFLLEDDFSPTPKILSEDDISQMTEEELIKQIALDEENGIPIPKLSENADFYYNKLFTKLTSELISDGNEGFEDQKEILRDYFDDALETFWEVLKNEKNYE